jgi:hypothetical protein
MLLSSFANKTTANYLLFIVLWQKLIAGYLSSRILIGFVLFCGNRTEMQQNPTAAQFL